jgi:hypothetical protein
MSEWSIRHQHVLYAAATHATLLDLLNNWQPWLSGLEWQDLAVHIPGLAQAIVELVDRGMVEVFQSRPDGEAAMVAGADVPRLVYDPDSWWRPDGPIAVVELSTTPTAGSVDMPSRRQQGPSDEHRSDSDHAGRGELLVLGQRLLGRVIQIPVPGRIGIFVDLGMSRLGFVDALRLPDEPDQWPDLDATLEFEVVGLEADAAIRLRPVDPRYGNQRAEELLRRLLAPETN